MQWTMEQVQNWEELREYVDTALLPLYLLTGDKPIPAHVERMTYLMNIAAAVEQKLRGRVLLFPLHYQAEEGEAAIRLPEGFKHYMLLQFDDYQWTLTNQPGHIRKLYIGAEDLQSSVRFAVTADVLQEAIIKEWQIQ